MRRFDVLIIGAGHGGAQVASSLRQRGFQGSIGLVGDEFDLPYERPPLSKEYLSGEKSFEQIMIRPAHFWPDNNVTMILGRTLTEVDSAARVVTLCDHETLGYNFLVWSTGGRPRLLSCDGAQFEGVHVIRTRADVTRILAKLDKAMDIVIVGGGYIGLETAAALTKFGKKITVLEAQERVLARVAGEPLSRFYEAEHRAHGVNIRLNTTVESIVGQDNHVIGLRTTYGEVIPAQIIIVGIGIVPAVGPLIAAGAEGRDGVAVDHNCQTSLPDVYAIGDCAAHANVFGGGAMVRLESVQNANDQALTAVKAIMGMPERYRSVPWFWSTQYDLRLQTVGLSAGHDSFVMRGATTARSFSVIYIKQGRVIALDCVNAPRDYVQGRKLVVDGALLDKTQLADINIPLKEIVA